MSFQARKNELPRRRQRGIKAGVQKSFRGKPRGIGPEEIKYPYNAGGRPVIDGTGTPLTASLDIINSVRPRRYSEMILASKKGT